MAGWSTACRCYAAVFMVFTLANVGLPGTSGFIGEFLSLIGTFKINTAVATLATFGVILSAAYALWLYRKMIFGNLKPALVGIKDIGWRETLIFTPLVALTILFGVAPEAGARHVGGLGRPTARQLQARHRRGPGAGQRCHGLRRRSSLNGPTCPVSAADESIDAIAGCCRSCRNSCWRSAPW